MVAINTSSLTVSVFIDMSNKLRDAYDDGGYPTIGNAVDAFDDMVGETFGLNVYETRKLYADQLGLDMYSVTITVEFSPNNSDMNVRYVYNVVYGKNFEPCRFKCCEVLDGSEHHKIVQSIDFRSNEYCINEY